VQSGDAVHEDDPEKLRESLSARSDDPWVGVHVLTEFMFCHRAGTIAFEAEQADAGDDGAAGWADLSYSRLHELDAINDAINRCTLADACIGVFASLGIFLQLCACLGVKSTIRRVIMAGIPSGLVGARPSCEADASFIRCSRFARPYLGQYTLQARDGSQRVVTKKFTVK
jgi:hypothetical protein